MLAPFVKVSIDMRLCLCVFRDIENTCTRHLHTCFWYSALTRAFNVREGILCDGARVARVADQCLGSKSARLKNS